MTTTVKFIESKKSNSSSKISSSIKTKSSSAKESEKTQRNSRSRQVTEINNTIESRELIAHDTASLAYTNEAIVKNQRSTLLYLAKKIGVNLLTGKSIMNISLPIKIFEPRSFLEKVAGDFRFAPFYLDKAMETTDPVERVRVMTTWHVCSLQLEPQMFKPFNPILGETFQGMIGDYDVAIEQISHHPPISAFQLWKSNDPNAPYIDGYLAFEASTGISAIIGFKKGEIRIHFPDSGQKIYSHTFQECEMYGLMRGTRTYDYTKNMKISDDENNIHAEIIFNPDKKGWFKRMFFSQKTTNDYFEGIITNQRDFDLRYERSGDLDKTAKKNKITIYSKIEGSWINCMKIDDQTVWEYKKLKPQSVWYVNNPLPSDCRFRTDLIALLNRDLAKAQELKEELDELQRNDRKLRKEASKSAKKKK